MTKYEQDALVVSLYDEIQCYVDEDDEHELLSVIKLWVRKTFSD